MIGTHGSGASPVSCNASSSYAADHVSLPEVNDVALANDVSVRVFLVNSAAARSQVNLATLAVDWYLH